MRVVLVTGIWPPDPGGPASHAAALGAFLQGRGHGVEVVTTADGVPAPRPYPVHWASRGSAWRHLRSVRLVWKQAAHSEVVYATSMTRRAALGSALAGRPLVVKLVSDEVFERARRSGRFAGTLDEFQAVRGVRLSVLRASRNAALRRAWHVFCPSVYLHRFAVGWGLDPHRLSILPNPAPAIPPLPAREELRAALGLEGAVLSFAGRLGPQKALQVALEAVAAVPEVTLAIAGDGPDREVLERRARDLGLGDRARFFGTVPRDDVLRLFRAADASLLSSSWENFPHTVVEALAVGSPVIATAVGGVPEVVQDGRNGLLVPPGDPAALAAAIRRFFADGELRRRLVESAAASVAALTEDAVFTRIEEELLLAVER
ncbi:MAG: glycosyltransferase [Gaiellaceae bacterium]|nr:glycosyltransferase [Actinomycetota bacterium]